MIFKAILNRKKSADNRRFFKGEVDKTALLKTT